jgi:peptidase M28-like protein
MNRSGFLNLAAAVALELAPLLLLPVAARAEVPADLWDGARAMDSIADQLRFTPRSLGTPGHQQTIDYIKAGIAKTGVDAITTQSWIYKGDDGKSHTLTNVVARLQPQNPRRVIVATHYDSIVRAYRDAKSPEAPMPGANNSASGVAVLLETARVLSLLSNPPVGIDLIFFDGEEGPKALGAGDPEWKALGSPYFAAHLKDYYPTGNPEKAVVFDMVCAKNIQLKPEPLSMMSALPEVRKFWSIGARIAPTAFVTRTTSPQINDDHTALAEAGIPSFLVIDFEFEPWFNTTGDTQDKCAAQSLEAVGRTLLQYLYLP